MKSGWVDWEAIGTDGEVQPRGQDNHDGNNVEIVQQVFSRECPILLQPLPRSSRFGLGLWHVEIVFLHSNLVVFSTMCTSLSG